MNWLNHFTRKRVRTTSAPFTHVKGKVLGPGAEAFAYEPTVGDPVYNVRVFPQWNFTPPKATQPPQVYQGLALPMAPQYGFVFAGLETTQLLDTSQGQPDYQ